MISNEGDFWLNADTGGHDSFTMVEKVKLLQ